MKALVLLSLSLPLSLVSCVYQNPNSEAAKGRKMMALLEKFDRFDCNGDGFLTKKEIAQGIKETDVSGVDVAKLDEVMAFYDVNKDGKISRWEAEHALDKPVPPDLGNVNPAEGIERAR